ncbi:glycerol-3-phosphate 1-O-acyltransferase PlsB [Oligoflexaceae bacterium]|nr:glycerol-3-phosphate 1-O-acyltransferase PlsB [Oligoflexaceae bacterium]
MIKGFLESLIQFLLLPFRYWIKVKLAPDDPKVERDIDLKKPILYVLPTQSKTDLFVLRWQCRLAGLPVPGFTVRSVDGKRKSGFLYLSKLGLLNRRRAKNAPAPLIGLLNKAKSTPNYEIQIVPVTIIWGRNPGKQENSLWELLFSDDENAGYVRKFLIMLVQGRSVFMHIGRPISMQEQASSEATVDQIAKKIRRVIRVHFHGQRVATLGPSIYDRTFVANLISKSRIVQEAIEQEALKKKVKKKKLEKNAYSYLMEIASEPKPSIIKGFETILRYIWSKIFDGVSIQNSESLRDLHATHEVVYLTTHRSHVDYLLLAYVLHTIGVTTPHTAAGVNLNFWPAGGFLRAGGGFFIRRSFKGNRLYSTVFGEYIHFLVSKGYTINFFPEGGRSRTGRTLRAKTGLLSMIVHSYLREPKKPVALVPVYVGYDSVVEIGSYLKELRGKDKKKESFGQLFGVWKIFKNKYGKAYVNFGEPMILDELLKSPKGEWDGTPVEGLQKPDWFNSRVNSIASEVMSQVNGAAVVSPVALAAMAILSTPQKAISESDFRRFFELSIGFLKILKNYYPSLDIASTDPDALIATALQRAPIQRFKYPGDDVFHLSEREAVKMNYYKNNIIHVFACISLIACQFSHNDQISREQIGESAGHLYPLIDKEFFIGLSPETFQKLISDLIDGFIDMNLLREKGQWLQRPDFSTESFYLMRHFGGAIAGVFEKFGVSVAILKSEGKNAIQIEEFEKKSQILSQRIAMLGGKVNQSIDDSFNVRVFVDSLVKREFLESIDGDAFRVLPKFEEIYGSLSRFLSQDILTSVIRSKVSGNEQDA